MEEAARFAVVEATEIQKLLEDNHAVSIQENVTNPSTIFTTAKLLLISELTEPILFQCLCIFIYDSLQLSI